jgi:hypothetical protein
MTNEEWLTKQMVQSLLKIARIDSNTDGMLAEEAYHTEHDALIRMQTIARSAVAVFRDMHPDDCACSICYTMEVGDEFN